MRLTYTREVRKKERRERERQNNTTIVGFINTQFIFSGNPDVQKFSGNW